jgi:quercetin dioxygenase-like cupin family protein
MTDELDTERLDVGTSPMLARAVVTLEPGGVLPYDEAAWHGAIVFVTAGEIELVCDSGALHVFSCGDVLWLERLPLRALRNSGPTVARLLTISRRSSQVDR